MSSSHHLFPYNRLTEGVYMMRLLNFIVVPNQRGERNRKRPFRERFGTALIEWGERIGGRNRRAEGLEELQSLMHLDIELTRHGGARHEGPWC